MSPAPLEAPAPGRALVLPWRVRVLDAASTYLPLLLMALLALGTWWLVKNTPMPDVARASAPPLDEPDYEMANFVVQRFAPDGSLRVRIEGRRLHHYPKSDTLEIDDVRVHAIGREGQAITATADRALSNADASEIQLLGQAEVIRMGGAGDGPQLQFRSEFLHFFQATESVRSHLPVTVKRGASEFRADAVVYDHLTQVVELKGRVRAIFDPTGAAAPSASP
jgi:lipopolysaccharide export system protein LptC